MGLASDKKQPMARADSKCSPVAQNIHQRAFMSGRAEAGMIKFNRHAKYLQHTPSLPLYLSDCQRTQPAPCNLTFTFYVSPYCSLIKKESTTTSSCHLGVALLFIIPVSITNTKKNTNETHRYTTYTTVHVASVNILTLNWHKKKYINYSSCPKQQQKYARFVSICLSLVKGVWLSACMQISMIGKEGLKDEDEQSCQNDCQQNIQMPQIYEKCVIQLDAQIAIFYLFVSVTCQYQFLPIQIFFKWTSL